MLHSAWIIVPCLNLTFENFEILAFFIIYGCNLTRYGWNMTRCGCNWILEQFLFYLLKIDNISGYWIMFSSWLGWPFGPPRSLSSSSSFSFSFSWKNRKVSIFKRRKSWKILWIPIYVSMSLFIIFQSFYISNKLTNSQ